MQNMQGSLSFSDNEIKLRNRRVLVARFLTVGCKSEPCGFDNTEINMSMAWPVFSGAYCIGRNEVLTWVRQKLRQRHHASYDSSQGNL